MAHPTNPPETHRQSLDRSVLSGVAWAGTAKWSTQLIAWASTIVVARILVPSDFGLLTMAGVFLFLVMTLSEFGIGSAVVTLRELSQNELRQLNALSLGLGLVGSLVTAVLAYPIGLFFRAPDLPPVLVLVGLTFLISSLQTVPGALLRRELKFRTLAMIDVARGLLVPVVTIVGALLGLRYWALALGNVFGAAVTTALTVYHRRLPFAIPRLGALRRVLNFSRHVLVGRVAFVLYQEGDFAVAGRRLGQAAAGDYSLAWTFAFSPIEKITMLLSDVTPSLFSAVQNNRPELRRYFLNLSEIICLVTFPASVGLSLVSRDFVAVLLGPKWIGAATPLALLAMSAGVRSVTALFGHLFVATRDTRFMMWNSFAWVSLLLAGFMVGSFWGPTGIAASWLIVHPLLSVATFRRVRRILELSGAEYVQVLRIGVDGAVLMAFVLIVFKLGVASAWSPLVRLLTSILLGAATYGLTTWFLHRTRLRRIVDWLSRIRRGEAAPPA